MFHQKSLHHYWWSITYYTEHIYSFQDRILVVVNLTNICFLQIANDSAEGILSQMEKLQGFISSCTYWEMLRELEQNSNDPTASFKTSFSLRSRSRIRKHEHIRRRCLKTKMQNGLIQIFRSLPMKIFFAKFLSKLRMYEGPPWPEWTRVWTILFQSNV